MEDKEAVKKTIKVYIGVAVAIGIVIFAYLFLCCGPRGKFYYCGKYGKDADTYFEFLGDGMARLCEEGEIYSANYTVEGQNIILHVSQDDDAIVFTYSPLEGKITTYYGEWRK